MTTVFLTSVCKNGLMKQARNALVRCVEIVRSRVSNKLGGDRSKRLVQGQSCCRLKFGCVSETLRMLFSTLYPSDRILPLMNTIVAKYEALEPALEGARPWWTRARSFEIPDHDFSVYIKRVSIAKMHS